MRRVEEIGVGERVLPGYIMGFTCIGVRADRDMLRDTQSHSNIRVILKRYI